MENKGGEGGTGLRNQSLKEKFWDKSSICKSGIKLTLIPQKEPHVQKNSGALTNLKILMTNA